MSSRNLKKKEVTAKLIEVTSLNLVSVANLVSAVLESTGDAWRNTKKTNISTS